MDKTILFGLDGATFTLLDALMDEGHLPCLRALLEGGVRAELLSTPHPLTPCAWTTLITGRMPGSHGLFDFVHPAEGPAGVALKLNMSHDIRAATLWSMVSNSGGTVTSINYPICYPPEPMHGNCVPAFVHWRHLRQSVHPPELYEVLTEIPGFDAKRLSFDVNDELESIQSLQPERLVDWIEAHVTRERQVIEIARHLLRTRPTDFFAVVLDGLDKLQHVCWHLLHPALRPFYPEPWERDAIAACGNYLATIDEFVGDLRSLAGLDTRIFVASDHGFCGSEEVFNVNAWLASEGYLHWNENSGGRIELGAGRALKSHLGEIDWKCTQAYALSPSGNAIYFRHLRNGTDDWISEAEIDALRASLVEKLYALCSPKTGRRLVARVMERDAFPGAYSSLAPDLTLVLHDHGFVSTGRADEIIAPRPRTVGTHHPIGIFGANGPGITRDPALGLRSIADMAPTLLYSLGLPIPAGMEGRIICEAFEPGFLATRPVSVTSANNPTPSVRPVPADAHAEAAVIERLKALGYLA
jgi:predicted AlkP superfamily phosphohydrolase/phosphomutase